MTTQENIPEHYSRFTPTRRGQDWVLITPQYEPPEHIERYADRALPLLPVFAGPRPLSSSSSIYNPDDGHVSGHMPAPLVVPRNRGDGCKSTTFAGSLDEGVLSMIQPPQISIPDVSHMDEPHPQVVSPQPQRPDSKLLSMWASGDEQVSPIDTPGPTNWKTHAVSPLSDGFEKKVSPAAGPAPVGYASWFDDTSSSDDEEEPSASPKAAEEESQIADIGFFSVPPESQIPRSNFRYSDPGSPLSPMSPLSPLSPLSPSFDLEGFCDPIPETRRSSHFQNAPGRRTVQPSYSGGEQTRSPPPESKNAAAPESNPAMGEPKISFAVPKIDSFSGRQGASPRPMPPPLKLSDRPVQDEYVKTPFPPRPDSAMSKTSEKRASSVGEPSPRQQKRRSGLGRFGSLRRRPSRQGSPKPPPGFTEMLSQLDKQGVVSTSPKSRSILSKAKQGLRLNSEESKREKRRDELKRQVRHASD
ncbi:hypothetical protein F5Y08DRAFT_334710 [Xylaria arbuscula]|nr:hypothetical protein F5Y08DRAFT_334710 [Xylaria arbuscula]